MALLNSHSTLLNIHSTLPEHAILSSKQPFVSGEGRNNCAYSTRLVMSPDWIRTALVWEGAAYQPCDLWKAAELSGGVVSVLWAITGIRWVLVKHLHSCWEQPRLWSVESVFSHYKHTSIIPSWCSTQSALWRPTRPACHLAVWNTWIHPVARGMKFRYWLWPTCSVQ